ncbi:hypothetical protein C8J57DRAFT_1503536 [Mycena rebaudengoi]|nr:hypothetical protein C8J57DRAFT_1503536 [Mycena rebaudengoi]
MSGVATFSTGRTKQPIRERYNYRCSVCKQYVVRGHCAHLFQSAAVGETHVGEAVALGILPSEQYDRTDPDNGTLQCPTCHLEYFTKGLSSIDFETRKTCLPLFDICLVATPWFQSSAQNTTASDTICCLKPPKVVPFGDDETAFRIFRHDADISASSSGGMISFHATGEEEDGPINFWRLPVPLPVVLYLFLREAQKIETITDSTRPEIRLGRDIYAKLSAVSDNLQQRKAKFASKPPPKTPSAVSQHASISVEMPKSSNADTGPLHSTPDSRSRRKPPVESEGPQSRAFPQSKASSLLSPDRESEQKSRSRSRSPRMAYPTPSSLPKPEHDLGADYFSSAPSGANKPLTGRSFTSGASSPHSSESSKLSSVANPAASSSNEDSDYQPSEESESTDEWETDSDISSDASFAIVCLSETLIRRRTPALRHASTGAASFARHVLCSSPSASQPHTLHSPTANADILDTIQRAGLAFLQLLAASRCDHRRGAGGPGYVSSTSGMPSAFPSRLSPPHPVPSLLPPLHPPSPLVLLSPRRPRPTSAAPPLSELALTTFLCPALLPTSVPPCRPRIKITSKYARRHWSARPLGARLVSVVDGCDTRGGPLALARGMDGGFLAAWDGSILAACGSRLCSSTSPTHGRPLICLNFAPLPTDSLTSACPARLPLAARWYRGCGLGDSPSPAWTRQRARPSSWDRGIPAAFAH